MKPIFARRAVHLAKADLVTQMVTEMTSLQGIIGREYALRSGEQKDVAKAIGEQYQTVPKSKIGLAVALTDTHRFAGWPLRRGTGSHRRERSVWSAPRRDRRRPAVDRA